jgi:glyoxylase-like metal-dependent hydrolase (beta-lactamase superfamily II)
VIDPSRLIDSARRLYGDAMGRLWGEIAPVPAERVTPLAGGEEVEGCRVQYAPGHARHHVIYVRDESGDAFVGDVAGVRVPPSELTMAPTPPPEIEVDAWLDSLARLRALRPRRLCMTHFGAAADPDAQIDRVERWLREAAAASEAGDRDAFASWIAATLDAEPADVADRMRQAMPPEQLWLGMERYWRKRREGEPGGAPPRPPSGGTGSYPGQG